MTVLQRVKVIAVRKKNYFDIECTTVNALQLPRSQKRILPCPGTYGDFVVHTCGFFPMDQSDFESLNLCARISNLSICVQSGRYTLAYSKYIKTIGLRGQAFRPVLPNPRNEIVSGIGTRMT